ncbi:RNA polymerase sigma factor [uncultured Microbulbifer sp.]|uniref:RNA polymerase sigma factor n=1 Tax=uncultured Microbulbifer sp. TaxID=348147 RepID=UPI002627048B|nr:RNA polymerase sigma factor [uncultured Microbulbifer sp.]
MPESIQVRLQEIYQTESRQVLATLIRLLGDFDLAEEALQESFAAALCQWPADGIPDNPRAWLVSTGRFKAIDQLRRKARFDVSYEDVADRLENELATEDTLETHAIEDDRLRLIFTCCHPSLAPEAQLALTLREVCGLTTEAIASAFLISPPTLAQRIVRAKAKIRDAKIPYEVPRADQLAERLASVLHAIYLIFNEGYSASSGDSLVRRELAAEGIRLARLVCQLLPEPEVEGLLALLLLQDSRRKARVTTEGDLILLEQQDRSLWDQAQVNEGCALVLRALASRRFGPYTLQAAIAAVHAEAATVEATDWPQIVGLYDALLERMPSPVIQLNRAVALAMRDGPAQGLVLIDDLLTRPPLSDYHLAHAARADLCRRLGQKTEAQQAYQRALALAQQGPERRFLARRLAELDDD